MRIRDTLWPTLTAALAFLAVGCGSDTTPATTSDAKGDTTVVNVDLQGVDWTCTTPTWTPPTCAAGSVSHPPLGKADHIDLPTPISYTDVPPASGPHRPAWGKWGAYSFLPPQRWLHNLEHGAVAILYHPCLPEAEVAKLKAWAKAVPADAGGAFRWVLTPYPNLPSAVGLVSWGHVYLAPCWNTAEADDFLKNYYRKAPEDEAEGGSYAEKWLGL
ncbi:MAG: DUF3105 domain-containing protein [Deltaproteobacteria bacterium]|nr:DUF3105 domain-containing protein [Deltaproteobacteria bacterium]